MVKLSIVIPVYNVDRYLCQCIDSVLNQNVNDSEIILVDDGSTDKSGIICDEYQKKDRKIKVIHKKNGGLSNSRNTGILASSGQYIMFLDSDDWWNPEVKVANIISEALKDNRTEMITFSSLDYFEGKGIYYRKEHALFGNIRTDSVDHYYQDLLRNGNMEVSAATKILDRSFLLRNNLLFKPNILGEDNEWMIRVLRHLHSVAIIDQPIYICRRRRPNSITNSIGVKNVADLLKIVSDSIDYNKEFPINYNEMDFCSYLWFCALGLSGHLRKEEFISLKQLFISCSVACQYSRSPKTKLAYSVFRIAGISVTRNILNAYILFKNTTSYKLEKVNK